MYNKWRSYDAWFPQISSTTDIILCHFGVFFALYPQTILKIKILKKLKKTPGNIIILHMSTINQNHMMHDSWDMECNRQNVFSFWIIFALLPIWHVADVIVIFHFGNFLPFYPPSPLTAQTIKISKNEKNCLEIYTVPEIWCMADVIVVFHFGQFFALLLP